MQLGELLEVKPLNLLKREKWTNVSKLRHLHKTKKWCQRSHKTLVVWDWFWFLLLSKQPSSICSKIFCPSLPMSISSFPGVIALPCLFSLYLILEHPVEVYCKYCSGSHHNTDYPSFRSNKHVECVSCLVIIRVSVWVHMVGYLSDCILNAKVHNVFF